MSIRKPLSIALLVVAAGFAWGSAHAATVSPTAAAYAGAYPEPSTQKTYYLQRIPGTDKVRRVYIFSRLDANHDGQLERSEIPKEMHLLRRDFLEADWDGNLRLSPTEYVLWARHQAPKYTAIWHGVVFVWN